MRLEQIQNPTGKGALTFRVDALAHDPMTGRVAGSTADYGRFFDAETGSMGPRWSEPSGHDRTVFRADGALVVVGMNLAVVTPDGKRQKLGKGPLFKGYRPPYDAALLGDTLLAAHSGEDTPPALHGIDVWTGARRWQQKGVELCGLTVYDGQVWGAHGAQVVRIDVDSGALTPVGELPWSISGLWVDADGLWVAGGELPGVRHLGWDGAVRATWTHPAGDPRRVPLVLRELVRVGGRLYGILRERLSGVEGVIDGYERERLLAWTADLSAAEALPLGDALTVTAWSTNRANVQPQALLAVGDALWIGTADGLLRGR